MIILGDISGIQRYLFDVSETGGGQARRLRARSFLVQALVECAALRVLDSIGWPPDSDHFLFSAGKFILRGSGDANRINRLSEELNRELLHESFGELRLAMGVGAGGSDVADYRHKKRVCCERKQHRGSRQRNGIHRSSLRVLHIPCWLCRAARPQKMKLIPTLVLPRRVCRHCSQNYKLGRVLPRARVFVLQDGTHGDFSWFGISGELRPDNQAAMDGHIRAVVSLDGGTTPLPGCPQDRFISRRLMTSIPVDVQGDPVWFTELAKRATGDELLAVLKADVDSLGVQIEQRLTDRTDLTDFLQFADSLDKFFADELRREISGNRCGNPFTSFSRAVTIW